MAARAALRAGAVLGVAALTAGLAAAPAGAATPESSTLAAPKSTGTVTSAWSGSFQTSGLELAFLLAADTHTLTITVPGKAAKYFKKRDATVHVDLTWDGGSSNDMDLYVFQEDGTTEVASSTEAGTEGESVTIPVTGPVTYVVEVDNWLSTPGTAYQATATLTVTPKVPIPCSRMAAARC